MFHLSVIVSVYNRFDYLQLVLAGLERQTLWDFEVIIADDGSDNKFVDQLKNLTSQLPFPLIHIRQDDKGFRKNKILNKAIVAANSDYLVFIDGDCVPHSEFLNEHSKYRKNNVCLTGRRVNLSEKITGRLSPGLVKKGFLEDKTFMLI
ncbi:MAG TPA: glycosyltransferase, partial [Ignavibacteriaceae bacterium]